MFQNILKNILMLMPLIILANTTSSWAGNTHKEVYLKEINTRIGSLLKHSSEATFFLGENLDEAIKTLEEAHFIWIDSQETPPLLVSEDGNKSIYLSSEISFLGTNEDRIASVLKILFNLKRQLEASTHPIPTFRIEIFSRKFSPILLSKDSSCHVSLYSLPKSLTSWQREAFHNEFLSLLNVSGYGYSSKWSNRIVWFEIKEYSNAECFGNNQNILELSANIVDIQNLTQKQLAKNVEKKCGHNQPDLKRALKKIFNQLKHDFPECHQSLINH